MNSYLPVGTLIDIHGIKSMIIGYDNHELNNKIQDGYLIVKFPIGFTGIDSIAFIPADEKFDIINIGFNTKKFDEYLSAQKELMDVLMAVDADIAYQAIDESAQIIDRMVNKSE